jgi:DNA-binding transcriptional LysR family regulator
MKVPDLRKLRHAVVLAEVGSYARASAQLHLSQSALSRSIQALEQELGLMLFDRSRRAAGGVRPTRAGAEILARATALLTQAASLQREIDLRQRAHGGHIAFGVGPAMPSLFLPRLMVQLSRDHPSLSVDVTVESPHRLLELLLSQTIEFFVADSRSLGDIEVGRFEVTELVQIAPAFFARRDHPLQGERINPAELGRYPLISPQHRQREGRRAAEPERTAVSRIHCNDLETLRQLVLETDAVLLGLKPMVKDELLTGAIRQLRVTDARHNEPSRIALIALAEQARSPAATAIGDKVRQLLAP